MSMRMAYGLGVVDYTIVGGGGGGEGDGGVGDGDTAGAGIHRGGDGQRRAGSIGQIPHGPKPGGAVIGAVITRCS